MPQSPILQLEVLAHQAYVRTRASIEHNSRLRGDAGEISSTVIFMAVLCTLALAVGAIIVARVTAKAESIPTE